MWIIQLCLCRSLRELRGTKLRHLTLQEAMIAATAIFLVFNFLAQITPKTAYTFFWLNNDRSTSSPYQSVVIDVTIEKIKNFRFFLNFFHKLFRYICFSRSPPIYIANSHVLKCAALSNKGKISFLYI